MTIHKHIKISYVSEKVRQEMCTDTSKDATDAQRQSSFSGSQDSANSTDDPSYSRFISQDISRER